MNTRASKLLGNGGTARRESGFTMAEIAIALGVIAFALIAIVGILPSGLQVQRDNREETIINQDARLLLAAIRSGGRDVTSDLGAFVDFEDGVDKRQNRISTAQVIRDLSDANESHVLIFSAISGAVAGRGMDLGFHYQVFSSVTNLGSVTNQLGGAKDFDGTVLSNQVHEVRLRFAWPVKPDGTLGAEANRYLVRGLISGWHTNGVFYAQEFLNR